MLQVALLTNMLPPYRVGLFDALAAADGIELTVYVCQVSEPDRRWGEPRLASLPFRVRRLAGWTWARGNASARSFVHVRPGVIRPLLRDRPDVLLIGDASWTGWGGALAAGALGIPYALWSVTPPWAPGRAGVIGRLRRGVVRGASALVAPGTAAASHLRSLGASPAAVAIAPNAVNNGFYFEQARRWGPRRAALRRWLGCAPSDLVLLHVGQLIPRKRAGDLVRLMSWDGAGAWRLVLVGSGPEDEALRRLAGEPGVAGRVHFAGFQGPGTIGSYYAAADALALVSGNDPWGLVINEAMCFGLPVLTTNRCGAAWDLVDERNGCVVDVGRLDAMAGYLDRLAGSPELRRSQGAASIARIRGWTRQREAAGFAEAIRRATGPMGAGADLSLRSARARRATRPR